MGASPVRGLLATALSACLWLAACGGGGGGKSPEPSGSVITPSGQSGNRLPATALDMGNAIAQADGAVHVHQGAVLTIDASGSQDPDGDPLTFKWTLISKPADSKGTLITDGIKSPDKAYLSTDVKGTYQFAVTLDDGNGGTVSQVVKVVADNTAPVAATTITVDTQSAVKTLSRSVTVGSLVTLDASGSKDADGDPLSTSWAVTTLPADSNLGTTAGTGNNFRFTADKAGTYRVQARTVDPKGAAAVTEITITADNRAPTGVVAVFSPPTATLSTSSLTTSLGYQVLLNGGGSKDADGDTLTYQWELISAPTGSKMAVTGTDKSTQILAPDMLGTYLIRLTVTDTKGAQGVNDLTLVVDNNRPVASIEPNATPQALANAPQVRLPAGVAVKLRGSSSYDADGDALTYAWSIVNRPAGSMVGLDAYDRADATVTPDVNGLYTFKLRVTDVKGAYSETTVDLVVGGAVPVVTLDRTRVLATVGETVAINALASLADTTTPVTYTWALDTKPTSSALADTWPATAGASITPDVAGTYILSVTAKAGAYTATASVVIVADKSWSGAIPLDFRPDTALYNRTQDIAVLAVSAPSPAVKIVDPVAKTVFTVPVPKAIVTMAVSPDGQHVAVSHDALVSYIDTRTAALIRSVSYAGNVSSAILTNDGVVYLAGHAGGGGSDDSTIVVDLKSGQLVPRANTGIYWAADYFYGYVTSVYADKLNKLFYEEYGLSPTDIKYQVIDPTTHAFTAGGDSPYHGDYPMGNLLWLNEDQTVLFTSYGNMFNTSDLRYAGTVDGLGGAVSLSQSKAANEIITVVYGSDGSYYSTASIALPTYRRFVGDYMTRVADVSLPLIDGKPSYALKAFHSGAGKPVLLVQVGSNVPYAAAATYHLVYR